MTCDKARSEFPFLLYGELSFDEEEAVERHLDACAGCRKAFAAEKEFHAALNLSDQAVPPGLLSSSRHQLFRHLASEKDAARAPWSWLPALLSRPAVLRSAGAFALLAIGFFSSRLVPAGALRDAASGPQEPVTTRVRYVEPQANGRVNIVLDETRQRRVVGELNDERVRRLLLAAAQDSADPGLRVDSVELLKHDSAASEVRAAFMSALRVDPNPGVRLKALEALKPYAVQPEVRRALAHVLLNDDNAGIRTQAVDLLTEHRHQDVVGVLQESMRREDNDYIRLRTQRVLREMNASVDTF